MPSPKFDLLVCGAGPVGCVIAHLAAIELNWKVLIIEKRDHIAGNCYDEIHPSGVLIHKYGPHYFRTNNQELLNFLSTFTEWIPGNYIVQSLVRGELYPFPINLLTLEKFFGREFTEETAKIHLSSIAHNFPAPKNSEEFILSRVGTELYEAFYKGYTLKQWNRSAAELDPSVCGRIPIRLNRDCRYVDQEYQLTPKNGFTRMFDKMIDHPKISVLLNSDFNKIRNHYPNPKATIYTGPLDEYFGYSLGKLPWRSLEFEFKEFSRNFEQPCVQINYPNDYSYTRSVEIKHVTKQDVENTVVSYEYPRDLGDPYYPIPSQESAALFSEYWQLAREESKKGVYFVGRLATYRYYNTDQVIEEALKVFASIKEKFQTKSDS